MVDETCDDVIDVHKTLERSTAHSDGSAYP